MEGSAWSRHYPEFARDLAARIKAGRLLDVGTGPGRMLREVHQVAPSIGLFCLDVTQAMIDLARRNLEGITADLRAGPIAHTEFDAEFFDAVTCTKSFYLWDEPAVCLAEVHQILKPGGAAYLYESTRDYDRTAVDAALKKGLTNEGFLRRLLIPWALYKQLGETYSNAEFLEIAERTPFRGACVIDSLPTLPSIWIRVTLSKTA
jgi:ubiquinone/menaquinone biosynthesis C-methylase UbiE